MSHLSGQSSEERYGASAVLATATKAGNPALAVIRKAALFNRRCPQFFRMLLISLRYLMTENPNYTGRIVITVHCKDGKPETVAVDAPDVPRRFEEVTGD